MTQNRLFLCSSLDFMTDHDLQNILQLHLGHLDVFLLSSYSPFLLCFINVNNHIIVHLTIQYFYSNKEFCLTIINCTIYLFYSWLLLMISLQRSWIVVIDIVVIITVKTFLSDNPFTTYLVVYYILEFTTGVTFFMTSISLLILSMISITVFLTLRGVWTRDIKLGTNIPQHTLTKTLKILEQRNLIKSVRSVVSKSKKLYMLYDVVPAKEITGEKKEERRKKLEAVRILKS